MSKRYTATAKFRDVFETVWTQKKEFDNKSDAAIWLASVCDYHGDVLSWDIYDNGNDELYDAMEM